jgi:hypothetical protein
LLSYVDQAATATKGAPLAARALLSLATFFGLQVRTFKKILEFKETWRNRKDTYI